MTWHSVRFLAFLLGALLVLTQPPYQLWYLVLPLHAGLYYLWSNIKTPRRAFWVGWLAGTAFFAFGLVWVAEAFLVDAATFGWMIPIAMPLLAGGLALFWGAAFWLAARMGMQGARGAFGLATCWMVAEAARGFLLTGFPWNFAGFAWLDTPVAQTAAYFGVTGLTLLTILSGCLLGAALVTSGAALRAANATAGLALIIAAWIAGDARLTERTEPFADGTAPLIGVVQPAIPQHLKWQPELREQHFRGLLETTRALAESGIDAVIWPEVATPFVLAEIPELRRQIGEAIGPGATLLTGALRIEARGTADQRIYNSLLAIDSNGVVQGHYDKQHLVPFGEYLPFDDLLTRLGLRTLVTVPGGLSSGKAISRRMQVPGLPSFAAMICYEAIFSDEIAHRSEEISWLLNITNDAWFGSSAGPYQHLAHARMRAIERGMPAIRAANTGISALIGPHGEIVKQIDLNLKGDFKYRLPNQIESTFYHRHEEVTFLIIITLLISASATIYLPKVTLKNKAN